MWNGARDYITITNCVECGADDYLTGFLCHACRIGLGYETEEEND